MQNEKKKKKLCHSIMKERKVRKKKKKINTFVKDRNKTSKECGLKHFAVLKYEQKMIQQNK